MKKPACPSTLHHSRVLGATDVVTVLVRYPNSCRRVPAPLWHVLNKRISSVHNQISTASLRKATTDEIPTRLDEYTAKMPSEVSDIKQFIEICRRKDAKCASLPSFPATYGPRAMCQNVFLAMKECAIEGSH